MSIPCQGILDLSAIGLMCKRPPIRHADHQEFGYSVDGQLIGVVLEVFHDEPLWNLHVKLDGNWESQWQIAGEPTSGIVFTFLVKHNFPGMVNYLRCHKINKLL